MLYRFRSEYNESRADAIAKATQKQLTEPIPLTPIAKGDQPAPTWEDSVVGEFEFTERNGRKVTRADLIGRPWAVAFIFTRCLGTCPPITAAMAKLQGEVQDLDVQLVSISVDPEHDTPAVLQKFADIYKADPERWWFLSGDKFATYELIRDSFKLPVKELEGAERLPGFEVLHSNNVMLVNAEGKVIGKYLGTDAAEMIELRNAIKKEAAKQSGDAGENSEPSPPNVAPAGEPTPSEPKDE
jgi:protein SCO1/2/putative membrane protein